MQWFLIGVPDERPFVGFGPISEAAILIDWLKRKEGGAWYFEEISEEEAHELSDVEDHVDVDYETTMYLIREEVDFCDYDEVQRMMEASDRERIGDY
jgi:hypothetical protein